MAPYRYILPTYRNVIAGRIFEPFRLPYGYNIVHSLTPRLTPVARLTATGTGLTLPPGDYVPLGLLQGLPT